MRIPLTTTIVVVAASVAPVARETLGAGREASPSPAATSPTQADSGAPKPSAPSVPAGAEFISREVEFTGGAEDVRLAGTLLLPSGASPNSKVAAVVLVTGSGLQDRDETIAGRKPFKVLAESLARRGFAVLRYDDRGTAEHKIGRSTGSAKGATLADTAEDAAAAIAFLQSATEIDAARVAICGHSTGGLEAAKLLGAARVPAAAVLLATPTVPGWELLATQSEAVMRAARKAGSVSMAGSDMDRAVELQSAFIEAAAGDDDAALRRAAEEAVRFTISLQAPGREIPAPQIELGVISAIASMKEPWMAHFLRYDPRTDLAAAKVPVLMVFGGRDIQVSALQNAGPGSAALASAGHPRSMVVVLPVVNHLFQECETGTMDEYGRLTGEMGPALSNRVADWLLSVMAGAPQTSAAPAATGGG